MKPIPRLSTLILTILILTACSSGDMIDPTAQSTGGWALHGITAEVLELPEDGICSVEVTGQDENFPEGTILSISYDEVRTNDSPSKPIAEPLQIGDTVSITYEVFEESEGQYTIDIPYVIIEK